MSEINQGQWRTGDESRGMCENCKKGPVVMQKPNDIVCSIYLGLLGKYLNEMRFVEAPENLQEDEEQGDKRRYLIGCNEIRRN